MRPSGLDTTTFKRNGLWWAGGTQGPSLLATTPEAYPDYQHRQHSEYGAIGIGEASRRTLLHYRSTVLLVNAGEDMGNIR